VVAKDVRNDRAPSHASSSHDFCSNGLEEFHSLEFYIEHSRSTLRIGRNTSYCNWHSARIGTAVLNVCPQPMYSVRHACWIRSEIRSEFI